VASLYITEFQASGNAESGAQLQVGVQPAVAMQKLTFTTSTQSAEFDDRTRFIRPTVSCPVLARGPGVTTRGTGRSPAPQALGGLPVRANGSP